MSHEASELEIAAETEETFARGLTMRARRARGRGSVDLAREYEGLAALHCDSAAWYRHAESALQARLAEIAAM